jgi:hypothetical protein
MFRRTPVVTLRSSIETFQLKLWDSESESLVPFPGRRSRSGRRYGIPPGGEAAIFGRRQGIAPD